jgi:hypothetical protein
MFTVLPDISFYYDFHVYSPCFIIQKRRLKLVDYALGSLRFGVWQLQRQWGGQEVSLQALQIQDLPGQGNKNRKMS